MERPEGSWTSISSRTRAPPSRSGDSSCNGSATGTPEEEPISDAPGPSTKVRMALHDRRRLGARGAPQRPTGARARPFTQLNKGRSTTAGEVHRIPPAKVRRP
ncbi:hypothetical protein Misp04_48460 [Micromonospora sp. NBRC 101691]|nr:hypothetical protein Misp04_48460 [Micromonospora sp. NBRC 101691]